MCPLNRQQLNALGLAAVRARLSKNLQHVQETGRPLFVTVKGRTAGVLLSLDAYDALVKKAELVDNMGLIERGLEDAAASGVYDAREDIRVIAAGRSISPAQQLEVRGRAADIMECYAPVFARLAREED